MHTKSLQFFSQIIGEIMDFFSIAKIAAPIAGPLANIAVKKGFEFINKTDIQKAIEAGIKAAEKQQEKLPQN
ncbi:hypothetical protein ACP6PL_06085 [Dapis sp. BLCC M126]|uniref:hypothetical protein n=1 Tax=Dapis sp. BLCC M126 TaxID=3400189 RepID=UPI003CE6C631